MKLIVFAAVLAMAGYSDEIKHARGKPGDIERALIRIEQELNDALLKGDASADERYLADSYVFTGPDGKLTDKAGTAADIRTGDLKFQSSKLDDFKVHIYGDTAVVTLVSTDKGTYKNKDISGRYRWTDVFVNRGGHWQLVATQGTRIAQP